MQQTNRHHLNKPDLSDPVAIGKLNANMDILDGLFDAAIITMLNYVVSASSDNILSPSDTVAVALGKLEKRVGNLEGSSSGVPQNLSAANIPANFDMELTEPIDITAEDTIRTVLMKLKAMIRFETVKTVTASYSPKDKKTIVVVKNQDDNTICTFNVPDATSGIALLSATEEELGGVKAKAKTNEKLECAIGSDDKLYAPVPQANDISMTGYANFIGTPEDITGEESVRVAISKLRAFCRASIATLEGFNSAIGVAKEITATDTIATAISKLYANSKGRGYGVCSTAAGVIAKEAEMPNFVLQEGAMVAVYFKYANSAADPTLNVNGTGAKAIYNCYKGAAVSTTDIIADMTCQLAYNGTQWVLLNPALTDGSEVSY